MLATCFSSRLVVLCGKGDCFLLGLVGTGEEGPWQKGVGLASVKSRDMMRLLVFREMLPELSILRLSLMSGKRVVFCREG